MKKLLAAGALALAPSFALAQQQCTELSDLQEHWQEQNITTNMVFAGRGDNGTLTYIFHNPANDRWSEWMARPNNPTCVRLYDMGSGASAQVVGFTEA